MIWYKLVYIKNFKGDWPSNIFLLTYSSLYNSKYGSFPVIISNKTQPNAHTSILFVRIPSSYSGDIYLKVPLLAF